MNLVFFEEFLEDKVDFHKTNWSLVDSEIIYQSAKAVALVHSTEVDQLDKEVYTRAFEGWWNTREAKAHFDLMHLLFGNEYCVAFYKFFGWSFEQFRAEVNWTQDLFRKYHQDKEVPVLW